jgi:hypothetical protein
LLHPHQGYESSDNKVKRDMCESSCVETRENDGTRGDFVADTPATPPNLECNQPRACQAGGVGQWCSNCQGQAWRTTNFHNVMGYAPDKCIYDAAVAAFMARGNNSASTGEQMKVLAGVRNGYLTPLQVCIYHHHYHPIIVVIVITNACRPDVYDVISI